MKRRSFIKTTSIFAGSIAATRLLSSSAKAQEIKELNFGIISTESQANQKPIWEPFISAMSEQLGMPVKAFYATQYAGVIEAMRFGQVQLAWYGGKSYIEAAKIADAEVFAQTVNEDGTKGYYSHLIMNKNNPRVTEAKELGGDNFVVQNAADLTFAFNDPNSTSGYLVPSYYVFAKNGVNPKTAFERLIFAGNHEATALAVANEQVDVATNNSESLSRLEKTNPQARENIEVVWTSTLIPSDPIAWRKDLPEDLKTQVKDFFYSYKDESVLGPLEWAGFDAAADNIWNPIRELDIGEKILAIQANDNLPQSEKDKQIAELNQQLEAIE
ncbi:phosphonate ABC transporter substrate-binding protein [Myxosarcina sp. GI1]|uniref:phosphonate ABC transporter substrate-binding protein n=1 Tax=Myxosarcina sp. GI1 TaxID=1541065 RepID=UPI000563041E|nr:phosphonate ABC transporter substrate-binding protein [Myxosarcina sp. GI1]